jgi:tetratricopeptide (TPR) repeat protein
MMKRILRGSVVAAAVVLAAGCASHSDLSKPQTQDNFGVNMARQNLWREAMFRFQRAVEINPSDAMAHNNLAVAYEANGDFDNARKEYLEALKLDRSNSYIQKNYSRYVEFLSRNKKRTAPKSAAASATPSTPAMQTGSSVIDTAPPTKPEATQPPRPTAPAAAPPVDLPQPPQPQPPQPTPPPTPPPPGGAR